MIDNQKAISPSWTWALAAIALTAVLAAALISMASGPASAADPDTCDPGRPHAAGSFDETITSGGVTREYILYVPPSYTGTETVPVVFNFHALTSTAGVQQLLSDLAAKADEAGFIVVAPQGLATKTDILPLPVARWNFLLAPPETGEADDVAFIGELLDALESQLCIDAAHVFSAGYSNGGQMSVRLACSLSDRIAAIAPVAGLYFPPMSPDFPEPPGCASTRPVPVSAFHGSADPIVPFDGGPGGSPGVVEAFFRLSIEEATSEWAAHNGCASSPTEEQVTENVRVVRYQDCDEEATVELYIVEGGGHTWPDAAIDVPEVEAVIGLTTHEISANDLMWDFFQAHPLAAAQEPTPTPTTSVPQPTATGLSATGADDSSSNAGVLAGIIAAVAAAAIALGGAVWYVRRRS